MSRWSKSFMIEVVQSIQQLGIKACLACGSVDGLGVDPRPVLIVDGEYPASVGGVPLEADRDQRTLAADVRGPTRMHDVWLPHAFQLGAAPERRREDPRVRGGRRGVGAVGRPLFELPI